MPTKKPTTLGGSAEPQIYVVTGIVVGPFAAGDEVTDADLEGAGLDAEHLIRVGHLNLKPAEGPTDPPAEEG